MLRRISAVVPLSFVRMGGSKHDDHHDDHHAKKHDDHHDEHHDDHHGHHDDSHAVVPAKIPFKGVPSDKAAQAMAVAEVAALKQATPKKTYSLRILRDYRLAKAAREKENERRKAHKPSEAPFQQYVRAPTEQSRGATKSAFVPPIRPAGTPQYYENDTRGNRTEPWCAYGL